MKTLGGWQRLTAVIAVLWAIVVAGYTIYTWPPVTRSEVLVEWASQRVDVLRTFQGSNLSHQEFRVRVFGNKSDEEIALPKGFDLATGRTVGENIGEEMVRVAEITIIDEKYSARLAQANPHTCTELAFLAVLFWAVPLLALIVVGKAAAWVHAGFRSKRP